MKLFRHETFVNGEVHARYKYVEQSLEINHDK